jgi:hypothetical protein
MERRVLPSQMKLEGVAFLIEVTHGQRCPCFDEDGVEALVLDTQKSLFIHHLEREKECKIGPKMCHFTSFSNNKYVFVGFLVIYYKQAFCENKYATWHNHLIVRYKNLLKIFGGGK